MIYYEKYTSQVWGDYDGIFENERYFGDDFPEGSVGENFNREYLNKTCITSQGLQGVIIGFEVNYQYSDCYYIVFIPELNNVSYELTMDAEFCKSVQL